MVDLLVQMDMEILLLAMVDQEELKDLEEFLVQHTQLVDHSELEEELTQPVANEDVVAVAVAGTAVRVTYPTALATMTVAVAAAPDMYILRLLPATTRAVACSTATNI